MKLLVVEDEKLLSKAMAKGLKRSGYAVDCAFDGDEALWMYEVNGYDLILLDLNLPGKDGMEVLREIRSTDQETKVLILSARDTVEDKIEGLNEGSNDYLTKPFDFRELEARIRNLLRRNFRQEETVLRCGDISLDMAEKTVAAREQKIALTKKEYSLLEYLMVHKGRVISMEELAEHVWDSEADLFSNTFKYHIHSLKKKLDEAGGYGALIKNLRGQGYKISEE